MPCFCSFDLIFVYYCPEWDSYSFYLFFPVSVSFHVSRKNKAVFVPKSRLSDRVNRKTMTATANRNQVLYRYELEVNMFTSPCSSFCYGSSLWLGFVSTPRWVPLLRYTSSTILFFSAETYYSPARLFIDKDSLLSSYGCSGWRYCCCSCLGYLGRKGAIPVSYPFRNHFISNEFHLNVCYLPVVNDRFFQFRDALK